jgi:hypothetical protein
VPAREWKPDVASVEFLVTEERADKTNCREPGEGIHCWGECIFLLIVPGQNGWRTCGVGTKAERILPALYGCNGLVDIESVESAIGGNN